MAVVRITAAACWHKRAAAASAGHPRLQRELLRASARPGLTAELQGDEARTLLDVLPGDAQALAALEALEASEERERTRPRARDIALGLAKAHRYS